MHLVFSRETWAHANDTIFLHFLTFFFQKNALIFLPDIIYAIYSVENKWNGDLDYLNSFKYENKIKSLIIRSVYCNSVIGSEVT